MKHYINANWCCSGVFVVNISGKSRQNSAHYSGVFIYDFNFFRTNAPFHTPWMREKIITFLTFSRCSEMENWQEMGQIYISLLDNRFIYI